MQNPGTSLNHDVDDNTRKAATQSLRDFATFRDTFQVLGEGFNVDVQGGQVQARMKRRLDVDPESLRQSGNLEANETFIPVRLIDSNIAQKLPNKLAYLKSANRLAIFEPELIIPGVPPPDTARVESEFWRVMTYDDWEIPYIRCMDGAEFVGFDWFEVLYVVEDNRPGNVTLNHVGRANLLFDMSVHSIQDSKLVAKRIPMTLVTLTKMAKEFGFKTEDVLHLREKLVSRPMSSYGYGDTISTNEFTQDICIYRVFFKEDGIVYTAWFHYDIDHWLAEPKEFYNGVDTEQVEMVIPPGALEPIEQRTWVPARETEYPFYCLQRRFTEDARIVQTQGAVVADYPAQDAACTIFSAMVNQGQQSTCIMGSPAGDAFDKSGAPKQLPLKIERGQIWDRGMSFFAPPPPDPSLDRIVQSIQQLNAVQNNEIAWAVQNREDSRKTATEIAASEQKQSKINSSDTLTLSICLRPVFTAAWRIVQSQALQGLIVFCPLADGSNDIALIAQRFKIKSAGDTDYVEKQTTIANMQQDWPIVVNTPAAMPFLSDYLRLRYPDKANTYIQAIQMGQMQNAVQDQQRKALLKEAVTDDNGNYTPEFAPYRDQIEPLIADGGAGAEGNPAQPAANAAAA